MAESSVRAAFEGSSLILMANGTMKNVNRLAVGDSVLNMKMNPTQITAVQVVPAVALHELRYRNWFMPSYVTAETEILTLLPGKNDDHLAEIAWTAAATAKPGQLLATDFAIYGQTLPERFAAPGLIPSADLGEFFGLYAGYGSLIDMATVEFKFGLSRELVDHVCDLAKRLFDVQLQVKQTEHAYVLSSDSTRLLDLFGDFGPKIARTIPRKYWIRHTEFLRGLVQGLLEYDPVKKVNRYIAINREMAQFFTIACSILGIIFENDTPRTSDENANSLLKVFPLLVNPEHQKTDVSMITGVTPNVIERDAISIETDCPTESVIINGLVMRCTARHAEQPICKAMANVSLSE